MTPVDWRTAVGLATFAPSVHNTQPWRFVVSGDTAQVWADRSRAVPALDPTGRQLVLSCGAAIEQLCLAVSVQGWRAEVDYLPETAEPDLLARVRAATNGGPSAGEVEMVAAIPHRATVRTPFEPRAIPSEEVEALRSAVALAGAWLQPITRPEDIAVLVVLLSHADLAEQTDTGYLAELQSWRTQDGSPEGVPDSAISEVTGRHTSYALRDFSTDSTERATLAASPVDEHPLAVIVGTHDDGVVDWIVAGRGVMRLLLRAATLGISASPLNQVIDDPAPRQQLRAQLGLVGHPQMVLRMGYGHAVPTTGRRPVEEVLSFEAT